jgi:hypothetical protein
MTKEKIKFHLPGIFRFFNIYKNLFLYIRQHPEVLQENIEIKSAYGSPTCIWNGGRVVHGYWSREFVEDIRNFMAEMNVPVRFTFTNSLIEEQHLQDTYSNMLLDIFNTGNNEILCNSPLLEDYIRTKYGDSYRYISSTTKCLKTLNEQTEELNKTKYHLIVLDYDYNKDIEYLNAIANKNTCEILCNPVCPPGCPKRVEHYENVSLSQLNFSELAMECENAAISFWVAQQNPSFISSEDIKNIYVPMGFSNFKLEGRSASALNLIEILVYYLIKDEYKSKIRDFLQHTI